jgi:mono/diheme cytochrome c family protein
MVSIPKMPLRHFLRMVRIPVALVAFLSVSAFGSDSTRETLATESYQLFEQYCFDCHDDLEKKGDLDLVAKLEGAEFDGALVFENLINGKMPPAEKRQPSMEERNTLLKWLASQQKESAPPPFRRISRHEFVHSVNDLLGTRLDLVDEIPEDRGTNNFDTDRRISLSQEMLSAYFETADKMLDFAFPKEGFPQEKLWATNTVKDSHDTYNIYHRPYEEGMLFSWTRANNGNNYSFFYDNFEPPVAGWYDLTFEAKKLGDFDEDISLQVYSGKYYYADDRPQPQRLIGVISLANPELDTYRIRAFLNPGENVSVHSYSKHTFRKKETEQGAYIKCMSAQGPVYDSWPPESYRKAFSDLSIEAPPRELVHASVEQDLGESRIRVASHSSKDLKPVLNRFAEKAFSSSLSDKELAPYLQVGQRKLKENGDFVQAARAGFKAIICSPRFLLAPGEYSSESHATAASLARTLWLSVPDEELQTSLSEREGINRESLQSQIDRMLRDERSQRLIQSFSDQWLNLRSLNKVTPSLKLYPEYNDLLDHYLPIETRAYLNHLIQENLPVSRLIDSDLSFLNQRLAQHYGIDGVYGQELRKISFSPDVPRGGLLTMGSVLKVTTDGYDTSPILRGAWISKNIVGTPISPPPEDVPVIEPNHAEAATLKEQIEMHKSNKACYACHKSIDPYGYALESFDATGQWRTRYRVEKPHQRTFTYRIKGFYSEAGQVDASGEIDDTEFDDIFGLKEFLLSDHRKIAYNFAKKFFEYANGYQPSLRQRLNLFDQIPTDAHECRTKDLVTEVLIYSLTQEAK